MMTIDKGDKLWYQCIELKDTVQSSEKSKCVDYWGLFTVAGTVKNKMVVIEQEPSSGRGSNLEKKSVEYEKLSRLSFKQGYTGNNNIINTPTYDDVVSNLAGRYLNSLFYTYAGSALLALNPMRPVPELYADNIADQYRNISKTSALQTELAPHIFAIAEEALRNVKSNYNNQSIIVSGESGAGKTMTAKLLLMYLMNLSNNNNNLDNPASKPDTTATTLHKKILQANPILEAFGNAATVRNANSSRFGKYLNLEFMAMNSGNSSTNDGQQAVIPDGCSLVVDRCTIETFLLEKSRVVDHHTGEQNYHVFYYLLDGATDYERESYKLKLKSNHRLTTPIEQRSSTYKPPSQTNHTTLWSSSIDSALENKKMMALLRSQFAENDISLDTQTALFQTLAGILHLGDIVFDNKNGSIGTSGVVNMDALTTAATLLGIEASVLTNSLTKKSIQTRGEIIVSPLSFQEAETSRDALVKTIYEEIFLWLVDKLNETTMASQSGQSNNSPCESMLGILDIYGFENFAVNSLEQLCINYANEKLQQQFVEIVFKRKQELYDLESIPWSFIEFADNSPCLELIEGKMGLLNLLDEQCGLKRQLDAKIYTQRLYTQYGTTNKYFTPNKAGSDTCSFTVSHYATNVTYNTSFFLAKNLDKTSDAHLALLSQSSQAFIQQLFLSETCRKKVNYKTVVSAFKASLEKLVTRLNASSPHYIKCIKPTTRQAGSLLKVKQIIDYDQETVVDQLKAAGIIDVVRISQAGYPHNIKYADFATQFHPLLVARPQQQQDYLSLEDQARVIIKHSSLNLGEAIKLDVQFGESMVFLRNNIIIALEESCLVILNNASCRITAYMRGRRDRKRFITLKLAAFVVQKNIKMYLAKKLYTNQRSSIIAIQCIVRMYLAKKEYHIKLRGILSLQKTWKKHVARTQFLKEKRSAIKIQSIIRQYLQRDTLYIMRQELEQERAARQLVDLIARLGGDVKIEFPGANSSSQIDSKDSLVNSASSSTYRPTGQHKMRPLKLLNSFSHSYETQKLIVTVDKEVGPEDLKAIRIMLKNDDMAHIDHLDSTLVFINDTQVHPKRDVTLIKSIIDRDVFRYNYCTTIDSGILHHVPLSFQRTILDREFIDSSMANKIASDQEMVIIQDSVLLGSSFASNKSTYDTNILGLPDIIIDK